MKRWRSRSSTENFCPTFGAETRLTRHQQTLEGGTNEAMISEDATPPPDARPTPAADQKTSVLNRPQHILGTDPLVEVSRLNEVQLHCRFLQREILLMRILRNLRRVVVAHMRVQRGH